MADAKFVQCVVVSRIWIRFTAKAPNPKKLSKKNKLVERNGTVIESRNNRIRN